VELHFFFQGEQDDNAERSQLRREQARERMSCKRQDPMFLSREKESQRLRYERRSAKRRQDQLLGVIARQLSFQPGASDPSHRPILQQGALRQLCPGPIGEQLPTSVLPHAHGQRDPQQDAHLHLRHDLLTNEEGRPDGIPSVVSGLERMRANQLSKEAQRRERNTQRRRLARLDPVFRQREREREQERRRRARQEQDQDRDPLSAEELSKEMKRRAVRKQSTEMQRRLRQDPAYRAAEREQDRERKRKLREDPDWKQAERLRNAERQRRARENPEYRALEREKDRERKRMARQDPVVREAELKRNAERQRRSRGNPAFRQAELKRNAERQRRNRQDPAVRQAERVKNAERQRKAREDPAFREAERQQNAERQRKLRLDPAFREAERLRLKLRRMKERFLKEGYFQPRTEPCLQLSEYFQQAEGAEQPQNTERCEQVMWYPQEVGGDKQQQNTERSSQVSVCPEPVREVDQLAYTERCEQVIWYPKEVGGDNQQQNTERSLQVSVCPEPVSEAEQLAYTERCSQIAEHSPPVRGTEPLDTKGGLQVAEYSPQGKEIEQPQGTEHDLQSTRNIYIKNEYLEEEASAQQKETERCF